MVKEIIMKEISIHAKGKKEVYHVLSLKEGYTCLPS